MIRYLRILRVCILNSIQLDLEYRVSFVIQSITTVLGFAAGLTVIYTLFQQGSTVGGWSFPEVLVLYGVFAIAQGTIDIVLLPSLNRISEHIKTGSMDYMLLKPINLQFLISVRVWNVWGVPDLLIGGGMALYGMSLTGTLAPENLALFALLLICGICVLYAITATIAVIAFWSVQAGGAIYILYSMVGAGRFPVTVYPTALRLFFTFVMPIAFVTTVPAAAAIGRLDWQMAAGSLLAAVVSLTVSAALWHLAARSYTSASS
jgi:ABC-2 type transport system permease protein